MRIVVALVVVSFVVGVLVGALLHVLVEAKFSASQCTECEVSKRYEQYIAILEKRLKEKEAINVHADL
jgi:uncharacterized membrane-anchored protein YhcB (DUF1043 family)